ncbi:MAG: GNAT family N-acetyltransferase [Smithellaceae bacterium]
MGLQIRKGTADDIPGMMQLFNTYTTPPKSAYFFHWWNNTPSVIYCAIEDEELVGMFVVIKRKLTNNLICGVLMGLLVNSDWRGRGLFKELGDKAMAHFDDMDLFCCLTNKVGKKALEKNFNFTAISNIETMVLAINGAKLSSNYQSTPITADTRFINFNKRQDDTIMFLADEEFRQWRYKAHPRYSYEMISKGSNEFAIVNKYFDNETNVRYGDIVDFETETLEEMRLLDLINYSRSNLKKDVEVVTIQAVPDSLLYEVSKKIGFIESNIKHSCCIKVKESCNEYLYDSTKWLIKWGDYLR